MNAKQGILLASLMAYSLTGALEGALPPLYQTADEIEAIVKSKDLDKAVPDGEPILLIRRNRRGYVIRTNRRRVQAVINYQPSTMPGPVKFDVTFEPAQEIGVGDHK